MTLPHGWKSQPQIQIVPRKPMRRVLYDYIYASSSGTQVFCVSLEKKLSGATVAVVQQLGVVGNPKPVRAMRLDSAWSYDSVESSLSGYDSHTLNEVLDQAYSEWVSEKVSDILENE